ncbi:MAG: acylphosphatase [Magnetovibrio sp.]|nr:acylphosphatase [Magnetovibrio sp.]
MTEPLSIHVIISGQVQGVWYRAWTQQTATGLGLSGWVKNRSDGAVEAVFSGPKNVVSKMLAACRQGPPAARVDGMEEIITDTPAEPGFHKR